MPGYGNELDLLLKELSQGFANVTHLQLDETWSQGRWTPDRRRSFGLANLTSVHLIINHRTWHPDKLPTLSDSPKLESIQVDIGVDDASAIRISFAATMMKFEQYNVQTLRIRYRHRNRNGTQRQDLYEHIMRLEANCSPSADVDNKGKDLEIETALGPSAQDWTTEKIEKSVLVRIFRAVSATASIVWI